MKGEREPTSALGAEGRTYAPKSTIGQESEL